MRVLFDEKARHPDRRPPRSQGRVQHLRQADLDTEVADLVAVVGEDDVDEVLADVVHVALDGCQNDAALSSSVGLLHVGLEVRHRRLHRLRRLQHERQLHLTRPEQLPDGLHATEQRAVDEIERFPTCPQIA